MFFKSLNLNDEMYNISAQIGRFEMFSIPYLKDEMCIILSVNWIFHYSDNVQNSHALLLS